MQFRVLGPLQVFNGTEWLPVTAAQRRLVLAILIVESGRVVTIDRLIDELWGQRPPASAVITVQGYVRRLRLLLGTGAHDVLVTRRRGYQLVLGIDDLDAAMFERLVLADKRDAADARVDRLRAALALWRGPSFADVPASTAVTAETARLDQLRLGAVEQRLGAELELGRHATAVDELRRLATEHPLREPLWAQLMIGLYRCGRRGEALRAYQDASRVLDAELGLAPGLELRELQRRILADDPSLAAHQRSGPVTVVPAQLPADVTAFTGRTAALRRLDALLHKGRAGSSSLLVISTIAGTAGVGKTALAVHWAHRVRNQFPDGQLYANLHGYAARAPVRPVEALATLLTALGVPPEQVPDETDTAAGLYRSLLADKRVLVLLDNARDPDQVRPLLPGSPGCLVLVTSRNRQQGLVAVDGARPLRLGRLDEADAQALLARLIGVERAAAEPDAMAELAELCGYLPLALRIMAAKLATHPAATVAGQVAVLRDGDRLTALQVDGDPRATVRTAFDHSYAALPTETRRLFRLLGLVPGPDLTADAAGALAGVPAPGLLDQLAGAHLVDEHGPGRYTMHDLIRQYASAQADVEESPAERRAALRRLFDHYLHIADAAIRLLYPGALRLPLPDGPGGVGFDTPAAALAWLDAERANLVAAVRHAAEHGPHPIAWLLANTLRSYFYLRPYPVDFAVVVTAGLAAATATGDVRAKAACEIGLGQLCRTRNQHRRALEHHTRALALARDDGWLAGQAEVIHTLGGTYADLGDLERAADNWSQALALYRQTDSRHGQATALGNLGEVHHARGRLAAAITALDQARALHQELGTREAAAETTRALAAAYRDIGDLARADKLARAAVAAANDARHDRLIADTLNTLASVRHHLGRHRDARDGHRQALDLARAIDSRYAETQALIGLATACPDVAEATTHAETALIIARKAHYRMLEGHALTALAAVHLARGDHDHAAHCAGQAIAVHTETHHRLGLATAHLIAAKAGGHTTDHHATAHALFAEIGAPLTGHARVLRRAE